MATQAHKPIAWRPLASIILALAIGSAPIAATFIADAAQAGKAVL